MRLLELLPSICDSLRSVPSTGDWGELLSAHDWELIGREHFPGCFLIVLSMVQK